MSVDIPLFSVVCLLSCTLVVTAAADTEMSVARFSLSVCHLAFTQLPPIESFKPLYAFEPHAKSQSGWMYRISVGVVLFATAYWVYVQPNAYHAALLEEQRNFVDELYNGKLLPDRSAAASENLDDIIPDYEQLLQEELAEQSAELSEEEQAEADILAEILKEDYDDDDVDDDDE